MPLLPQRRWDGDDSLNVVSRFARVAISQELLDLSQSAKRAVVLFAGLCAVLLPLKIGNQALQVNVIVADDDGRFLHDHSWCRGEFCWYR